MNIFRFFNDYYTFYEKTFTLHYLIKFLFTNRLQDITFRELEIFKLV